MEKFNTECSDELQSKSGIFMVKLSSVGNPDHGENPFRPVSHASVQYVKSLQEASDACSDYIKKNNLGGGNWSGGKVVRHTKKEVARIGYNGRIWLSDESEAILNAPDAAPTKNSKINKDLSP